MSRYPIEEARDVVVGWDPPLAFYFIQEFDTDAEEEVLLHDHECYSVEDLVEVAGHMGVLIPDDILASLREEGS